MDAQVLADEAYKNLKKHSGAIYSAPDGTSAGHGGAAQAWATVLAALIARDVRPSQEV